MLWKLSDLRLECTWGIYYIDLTLLHLCPCASPGVCWWAWSSGVATAEQRHIWSHFPNPTIRRPNPVFQIPFWIPFSESRSKSRFSESRFPNPVPNPNFPNPVFFESRFSESHFWIPFFKSRFPNPVFRRSVLSRNCRVGRTVLTCIFYGAGTPKHPRTHGLSEFIYV